MPINKRGRKIISSEQEKMKGKAQGKIFPDGGP